MVDVRPRRWSRDAAVRHGNRSAGAAATAADRTGDGRGRHRQDRTSAEPWAPDRQPEVGNATRPGPGFSLCFTIERRRRGSSYGFINFFQRLGGGGVICARPSV